MDISQFVQLGSFIVVLIGSVLSLWRYFNGRVNRVYERFDEYKEKIERDVKDEFVNRDLCKIVHLNSDTNFNRLEKKVDEGFRELDKKITLLLNKNA